MSLIPIGTAVTFAKTVTETDIYLFAGITGDFSPNHVNAQYMAATPYGGIIAHGALLVGLMSACSTRVLEQAESRRPAVSLGYDRIRFVAAVRPGDTVTITYTVVAVDEESSRTIGDIVARNQHDEVVAVASHILKFL